ncbi:MAG: hypothetical protein F7C35_01745 [Desulfurococcales archaeon]|nr:hypothetical protein [Desulfurococcales archaeon]
MLKAAHTHVKLIPRKDNPLIKVFATIKENEENLRGEHWGDAVTRTFHITIVILALFITAGGILQALAAPVSWVVEDPVDLLDQFGESFGSGSNTTIILMGSIGDILSCNDSEVVRSALNVTTKLATSTFKKYTGSVYPYCQGNRRAVIVFVSPKTPDNILEELAGDLTPYLTDNVTLVLLRPSNWSGHALSEEEAATIFPNISLKLADLTGCESIVITLLAPGIVYVEIPVSPLKAHWLHDIALNVSDYVRSELGPSIVIVGFKEANTTSTPSRNNFSGNMGGAMGTPGNLWALPSVGGEMSVWRPITPLLLLLVVFIGVMVSFVLVKRGF